MKYVQVRLPLLLEAALSTSLSDTVAESRDDAAEEDETTKSAAITTTTRQHIAENCMSPHTRPRLRPDDGSRCFDRRRGAAAAANGWQMRHVALSRLPAAGDGGSAPVRLPQKQRTDTHVARVQNATTTLHYK